jgi:hypothetical protein
MDKIASRLQKQPQQQQQQHLHQQAVVQSQNGGVDYGYYCNIPAGQMMTRRRSMNVQQQQPQMLPYDESSSAASQLAQQQQQQQCGSIPTRGLLYPQGYTHQPLDRIYQEIERSLGLNNMTGYRANEYSYNCEDQSCRFRVDIVRRVVPVASSQQQQIIHDLQINLITGGSFWNQRQLANRLFKNMRL